jgi:hypothetical protein
MFNHETKLIGSTFSPMKKGVYAYMYETIQWTQAITLQRSMKNTNETIKEQQEQRIISL